MIYHIFGWICYALEDLAGFGALCLVAWLVATMLESV